MSETPPADADALLLTYLGGRDAACPSCGYNLRDLREPRCPECGDRLTLAVRGGDRSIAWPIAGLLPLSGVAMFDLGLSAFFLYSVVVHPYRMSPNDWVIFWGCFAVPGVVMVGLLTVWIRNWRRVARATRPVQLTLAGVAWLTPVCQIALVTATAN